MKNKQNCTLLKEKCSVTHKHKEMKNILDEAKSGTIQVKKQQRWTGTIQKTYKCISILMNFLINAFPLLQRRGRQKTVKQLQQEEKKTKLYPFKWEMFYNSQT